MMSSSPLPDLVDYEAELERRAGGSLSADDVGRLLSITRHEVEERRQARSLLAIRQGNNWTYPNAQFVGKETIPCLATVVEGLQVSGPWVTLEFLVTPDDALGGLTPREALLRGEGMRDQVVVIVRGHREGEGFA